ncbi:hypothetical protein SDJN03_25761, partial [Cucurbita argyrosperma subsp. sororia]
MGMWEPGQRGGNGRPLGVSCIYLSACQTRSSSFGYEVGQHQILACLPACPPRPALPCHAMPCHALPCPHKQRFTKLRHDKILSPPLPLSRVLAPLDD